MTNASRRLAGLDRRPGNLLWRADGTLVYLDHGLLSFVQPKHSQVPSSVPLLHPAHD